MVVDGEQCHEPAKGGLCPLIFIRTLRFQSVPATPGSVIAERNPQIVLALKPVKRAVGIGDPLLILRTVECLDTGVHHRRRLNGLLIEPRLFAVPG